MPKRKPTHKDIDAILQHWPHDPVEVRVRTIKASDGRDVLQMRIELGVLQLETAGRPDGEHVDGFETLFDALLAEEFHNVSFELTEEQCANVDREFMQFYHRRICWLQLGEFERAMRDADHTLALMDLVRRHSASEEWTHSHEQFRPLVLYHRTHAAARAALERPDGAEAAIGEINAGLSRMRGFFESNEHFNEVEFESLEIVQQLTELREALRDEYDVGNTLAEQLNDAIAQEEYERAASLRDEMRRRGGRKAEG